ncbi:hypothetical protein K502DRAFT_354449 [Neoconidiobolus thromboides FSU 785]|nr:hypothetical protein K502DRAFT_354449 [Neoconidiobolus thromboides FSU 785]
MLGKCFSTIIMPGAIGLQISSSHLFSFLAQGIVANVAVKPGFYGSGPWLSVGICGISWIAIVIYTFVLHHFWDEYVSEEVKKANFFIKHLFCLPAGTCIMSYTTFFLGGDGIHLLYPLLNLYLKLIYGKTKAEKFMTDEAVV